MKRVGVAWLRARLVAALAVYVAVLTPPFDSLIHPGRGGPPAEPRRAERGLSDRVARDHLLRGLARAHRAWFPASSPWSAWRAAFRSGTRSAGSRRASSSTFCLVTLAPLLPILFFDRYLLGVVPLFGILIAARHQAGSPSRGARFRLGVLRPASGDRRRHDPGLVRLELRAGARSMRRGACTGPRPSSIDAGFEHNERRRQLPTLGTQLSNQRPEVPKLEGRYVVSFSSLPDHEAGRAFCYGLVAARFEGHLVARPDRSADDSGRFARDRDREVERAPGSGRTLGPDFAALGFDEALHDG